MERTLRLIQRAHEGDKEARDILVEENVGLVWSIVRRFQNRGVESEDLFQIGTIGLIKAVDKFDCSYEVCFSTYAVPMIAGEIKRYLRDDGILKVSRSLKETAGKAYRIREQQEKQTGREPTVREIAGILGIPPEELMEALRYVLNAREDFDRIRSALARDSPASDVQRAAWFYQLIRYSYASGLTSFGSQPHDMRSNFSLIEQAHRRLAKVVIENKDFEKLLHQYDRPVSFFYLDPPYHATEGYYQNIGEDGFTEADHIRLRDALMRIEGKFLLSYNDDAFVRGLYDRPGIYLMETTRINNIKQRYDNGAQFPELLIANYDLRERSRAVPSQMTLFDWNGGEAIG